MASYVTGEGGGDSVSDDNLQWLRHGPHDKNQTLAPVMVSRSFQGGEQGQERDRAVATAPSTSEKNGEDESSYREQGTEIHSRDVPMTEEDERLVWEAIVGQPIVLREQKFW